jgi:hypothetical protein
MARERIGDQIRDHFGVDTALCLALFPDRRFCILGAGVLRYALAVVGAADVHLAATGGAPSERTSRRVTAPPFCFGVSREPSRLPPRRFALAIQNPFRLWALKWRVIA